ncbi:MAG: hypothetical protein H6737_11905 [Alphaproteobacteria bacterium]|nr:hypothetical protein [Alphaproteobacteria bacterium]
MNEPSRLQALDDAALRFVARILLGFAPAIVIGFGLTYLDRGQPLILVEAALCVVMVAGLWMPRVRRQVRAGILSYGFLGMSVLALANFGPTIGTGVYFMGAAVACTFFFGHVGSAIAVTGMTLAYVGIGIAHLDGWLAIPNAPGDRASWIRMGVSTILPLAGSTWVLWWVRKQLELAFQAESAAAERERRALDELSFVVSHDLMEPVRSIRGFVGVVLDSDGVDAEAREPLSNAHAAATRMSAMVDDLLRYTKLGEPAPAGIIDPADIARDALVDLSDLLDAHPASVTIEPMPSVVANPARLRQAFAHLIANAVRNPRPGHTVAVVLRGEEAGDDVRITVTDDGIGVPASERERVMLPFQRLGARRGPVSGHGIGLPIVKRIVEQAQGAVALEDNPAGPGLRVVLTLPGPIRV